MEAPEKIYLNPALDALTEALSEKTKDDIEYTRTDALQEQRKEWSEDDEMMWRNIIKKFTWMEWYDELDFLRSKLNK